MGTRSTNNNKPNLTISDGHLLEYFRNTFRSTFGRTGGGGESAVTQYSGTGGDEIVTVNGYNVHIFTSPGTFTISPGAEVEYLVVAGGAAGGWNGAASGGGGGGGVVNSTVTLGGSYSVTVGAGGVAPTVINPSIGTAPVPAMQGSPSSIVGVATAYGGGRGGRATGTAPGNSGGVPGGCGGGGAGPAGAGLGNSPPTIPLQGFPGGPSGTNPSPSLDVGGGGGGASGSGLQGPGGPGGSGISILWGIPPSYGAPDIRLDPLGRSFSGGGGGWPTGLGGVGGGGRAVNAPAPSGSINGTATSGGGGGAGNPGTGPAGGSGLVALRYRIYQ